jgi:hypothetical protein
MPQAAGCRAHIAASGAIRARATSARWACRRARDTPVPCGIPSRSHIAAVQPAKFNPLPIDVGIGDDWIFFAEVLGLKEDELRRASRSRAKVRGNLHLGNRKLDHRRKQAIAP